MAAGLRVAEGMAGESIAIFNGGNAWATVDAVLVFLTSCADAVPAA